MLNLYYVEQMIKIDKEHNMQKQKLNSWNRWRDKNEPKWIQNERRRVAHFVTEVFIC